MFTGIIEHSGTIDALDIRHDSGRITIHAPTLGSALSVSNSIAVNGCCLTVVSVNKRKFSADLSGETLRKTSFGASNGGVKKGERVNLEQPLTAGKEFGGHFVLGHVDAIGHVVDLKREGESWRYAVQIPEAVAPYIVPEGSITIDGISLTVAGWNNFMTPRSRHLTIEVAVIPYTYDHTNIRDHKPGDAVNLEADILGKYVERYLDARNSATTSQLNIRDLVKQGF